MADPDTFQDVIGKTLALLYRLVALAGRIQPHTRVNRRQGRTRSLDMAIHDARPGQRRGLPLKAGVVVSVWPMRKIGCALCERRAVAGPGIRSSLGDRREEIYRAMPLP